MIRRFLTLVLVAVALVEPAAAQTTIVPGLNWLNRTLDGSPTQPSRTYAADMDLGSYRIGANNEGFTAGGGLVFDYNTSRVKLASGKTLDWNATSISEAEAGYLDGITCGTATASKLLCVDSNKDLASLRNLTATGKIYTPWVGTLGVADVEVGVNNLSIWRFNTGGNLLALGNYNLGDGAGNSPYDAYVENSLSVGPGNYATAGRIRLPNTAEIHWRNAANSGNIGMSIDGSNNFVTDRGSVYPAGFYFWTASNTGLSVAGGGLVTASNAYVVGSSAASAGAVRLPNNVYVAARNAANSGDASLLGLDGSDRLRLGDTAVASIFTQATFFQLGGTTSSFPALKRSSTSLHLRLADDSDYTDIVAKSVQATTFFYGGSATFLIRNTVPLNNGSGGATGTLTNSPTAGNPTKWIAIDDNGTTRYIPTWQ